MGEGGDNWSEEWGTLRIRIIHGSVCSESVAKLVSISILLNCTKLNYVALSIVILHGNRHFLHKLRGIINILYTTSF